MIATEWEADEVPRRNETFEKAVSTASALLELNCSWRLIIFELGAKYGYVPSDAKMVIREAFRRAKATSTAW